MHIYGLQPRDLFLEKTGTILTFPNKVRIDVRLQPRALFGQAGEGRTAWLGSRVRLVWNANLGKTYSINPPAPKPVSFEFSTESTTYKLRRNILTVTQTCNTREELLDILSILIYSLPAVLNLSFLDAPIIDRITGRVGATRFTLQFHQSWNTFDAVEDEEYRKRMTLVLQRLDETPKFQYRRLAVAMHYFHVSRRLVASGTSPWEFMAESILNLSKTLEVLFGQSMDTARAGLRALGYSDEEIEHDFIPVMVLRNHFGVGHVALSLPEQTDLVPLYDYLQEIEHQFRSMLNRACDAVLAGSYKLPEVGELTLGKDEQKKLSLIFQQIEQRKARRKGAPADH